MAYENTTVNVEKSQAEIRDLLKDHGAERFTFGESIDLEGVRWAGVEFQHGGHDPASDRTLWQSFRPMVDAGALKIGGRGLPQLEAPQAGDVVDAEIVEEPGR